MHSFSSIRRRLTMDEDSVKSLIAAARRSMEYSYCPYSNFPVGCALLCQDGTVFTENAAYSGSICAERTAVVKAVSSGYRKFQAVVVTSNLPNDFCAPCGNCRQYMVEFGEDLVVILANQKGEFNKFLLKDLLPHSFGPKDLLDFNGNPIK